MAGPQPSMRATWLHSYDKIVDPAKASRRANVTTNRLCRLAGRRCPSTRVPRAELATPHDRRCRLARGCHTEEYLSVPVRRSRTVHTGHWQVLGQIVENGFVNPPHRVAAEVMIVRANLLPQRTLRTELGPHRPKQRTTQLLHLID